MLQILRLSSGSQNKHRKDIIYRCQYNHASQTGSPDISGVSQVLAILTPPATKLLHPAPGPALKGRVAQHAREDMRV